MMYKVLCTILLFIVFSQNSLAQLSAPHITTYTPKDYGALKSPEVWSVAQDDNGIMYFGLTNEIMIFDGVNWDFIKIPNVYNITALKNIDGDIYFGAQDNFGKLTITSDNHLVPEIFSDSIKLKFSNIWNIHKLKDEVIYQAEEGLFILNSDLNTAITIKPTTSFHLSFESRGEVFIRERNVGLHRVKEDGLELVNDDLLLKEYGFFDAIDIDDKSSLLVTHELGFRKVDAGMTGSLIDPCGENCSYSLNAGIIGGISLWDNYHLAYSTTQGIFFFNNKGELIRNLNINSGLSSNEIKSVFKDLNGKLWLATGNGISKLEIKTAFDFFDENYGIIGNVQSLELYKGTYYLGSSLGLFKEEQKNTFKFENTSITGQVWDVINVDSSELFIASRSGLYQTVSENEFKLLIPGEFQQLYYDKINQILIAAGGYGVIILDGYMKWQPIGSFPFNGGNVTNIVYDSENTCYWVGSTNGGVIRVTFDGFDFGYTQYGINDADGLRLGEAITPFSLGNKVLFGTPYDLLRFINEKQAIEQLKAADSWHDSLIDYPEFYSGSFLESEMYNLGPDFNYQYYESSHKKVFAAIDNNLGYYNLNEGEFIANPFSGLDLGRINFLKSQGDYLFVGGSEGLVRVHTQLIPEGANYEQKLQVNLRSIVTSDTNRVGVWGDIKQVSIPYSKNKIIFKYASSGIQNDVAPLYSYKLSPDNGDWSKWTAQKSVEFSNLDEGDYTFSVKSKDVYGNESEVVSYNFTIEKPWYRTFWAYIAYVLIFALVVYLAVRIASARLKQQNIRLEELVRERTQEIREKNSELEHSYLEISEQKKEITDSINYAQRIQQAILPLSENIDKYISEYFVLFQPKDIVSGDFYWFAHTSNHSIFVCADCTGHGVPGAFMSMIGSDKLNQAVLEAQLTNPAEILSFVNKGIKKALKQNEEEENASRDGMDVTIVSIPDGGNKLQMAGAHNSLIMIRDGELSEVKATKVAVAGFTPEDQKYELNEVEIKKGDVLYMTTDGYPDQFGGEKGKKLKIAVMKRKLLEIAALPMAEQRSYLEKFMKEWMDDQEQIDDICVVGIRI